MVNQELFDALVRHQVLLMRLSSKHQKEVLSLLQKTEKDMADKIILAFASGSGYTPTSIRRLEKVTAFIKELRKTAFKKAEDYLVSEMKDLANQEPLFLSGIYQTVSPVVINPLIPEAGALASIVSQKPFEGRTIRQWVRNLRDADLDKITTQIKIGLVSGESSGQIARRIVGSRAANGADGIINTTRRSAQAIVRTGVTAITNAAKQEFYAANTELIDKELYVATLDSRTTAVCRANDNKTFPVGKGPIPPLHMNCRSLRIALLSEIALGKRPAKASTEKILRREYEAAGSKGSFQKFQQKRVRELTGQVSADLSYGQWLKTQTTDFQNDVLGTTKAKLFREGGLPLDKFVNRAGDELTLKQLAQKHRQAFESAGLSPENYL